MVQLDARVTNFEEAQPEVESDNGTSSSSGYTVYTLQVVYGNNKLDLRKRYSQFEELYSVLLRDKAGAGKLPFPGKIMSCTKTKTKRSH
jgi:hypothetical protein